MSLQECLASRKDCSGKGRVLPLEKIKEICLSTSQESPKHSLFVVLPDGPEYDGGIYQYLNKNLILLSKVVKTNKTLELYPELVCNDNIDLNDLLRVGITWQYLSLKSESFGLGVSQRAKSPKKVNKVINRVTKSNNIFFYSVAVRERDRPELLEDPLEPIEIKPTSDKVVLNTPECYDNRDIYLNRYSGVSLDDAIFNVIPKNKSNPNDLHGFSQLLWSCQGETDHSTHGNRDPVVKNGYGRVHASGCAGYAVYPILFINDLKNIPKGTYYYNPEGYSGLNRWISINNEVKYDHLLQKVNSFDMKKEIKENFSIDYSNYIILLCIDRKKPCSDFMHSAMMNTEYWSEIEAGMALGGLQLQANALGYEWEKRIIPDSDNPKYKNLFNLVEIEQKINDTSLELINPAKNMRMPIKGHLNPIVLFHITR